MKPLRSPREMPDTPDLGIRVRLKLLVAIGAAGLVLFAAMAFVTIDEIHAGSAQFAPTRVASDVARDFASPTQSLIGAETFFHHIRMARNAADIEQARQFLAQERARMEADHRHYLVALPPGRLRYLVTVDAYQSAEQWYNLAENEYLPLVRRDGWQAAEEFRVSKMDGLVARNLADCAQIGMLANERIAANDRYVEETVRARCEQLGAVGLALLLIQLLLGLLIDMRVGRSTQQLQSTLVELRRKNTEVEGFVYIVSHDLRAPLVNVQGFARELEESCKKLRQVIETCSGGEQCWPEMRPILEEDMPGALHFISASTAKFDRLINALIGFARLGRQEYHLARVNVWELASGAVDTFRTQIVAVGAAVEVGSLPAATADATALGQVFSNLLGNAMKYRSPDRPLRVEIGGAAEGEMVHYWVRDNGLGIPEASKDRLFQVFQRFHSQLAEGEGMGLAIAHRIVERHGGRIWAESAEGAGSIFHFSIPGSASGKPNVFQESTDHERV